MGHEREKSSSNADTTPWPIRAMSSPCFSRSADTTPSSSSLMTPLLAFAPPPDAAPPRDTAMATSAYMCSCFLRRMSSAYGLVAATLCLLMNTRLALKWRMASVYRPSIKYANPTWYAVDTDAPGTLVKMPGLSRSMGSRTLSAVV